MIAEEKFPDKKLLVEGNDDQHVIWALCQKFQVEETFDVIDSIGIPNLLPDIPVRAKQRAIKVLGIVADADVDKTGRWNQISGKLQELGYTIPAKPESAGTIISSPAINLPTVGIWLMPDNQLPGMIEDFTHFLIPEGDEILAFAEKTIAVLEEQELQKYIPNHRSKALIHTWLAWQEDPGTPMGLAITKRYLTTDSEICQQFVDWLNRLFNDNQLK